MLQGKESRTTGQRDALLLILSSILLDTDLKTQASFVFLPQVFCGNSAKLFIWIVEIIEGKINTEKMNFTL